MLDRILDDPSGVHTRVPTRRWTLLGDGMDQGTDEFEVKK